MEPSFLEFNDSIGGAETPRPGRVGTGDICWRPVFRILEAWESLEVGGFLCSIIDLISSASSVSYFRRFSEKQNERNPVSMYHSAVCP